MARILKGGACVWSMAAWNMFCLLKVRLFHYTPSIIQWCKHPLSTTFCQMPFTERASGRKRGRRNERRNARGRGKTDDKQRERQMEWARERHWVRMKYPEWEVWRDLQSILFSQWGTICLGWSGCGGWAGTSGRLNPKYMYSISFPPLCGTWSTFLQRQSTLQPQLHHLVNVFILMLEFEVEFTFIHILHFDHPSYH